MSLDHTVKMLETLKEYQTSDINMNIDSNDGRPLMSICYRNGCYQINCLNTSIVEACDDIESAINFIYKLKNVSL